MVVRKLYSLIICCPVGCAFAFVLKLARLVNLHGLHVEMTWMSRDDSKVAAEMQGTPTVIQARSKTSARVSRT